MSKTATVSRSSRDAEIARYRALKEKQKLSRVFEMPDLASPGEVLSRAEADFFMEHGFLIKKALLTHDLIEPAVDKIWDHLVKAVPAKSGSSWRLDRSDPSTWVNPDWAEQPPHPASGPFQGRQPIEHYGRIIKLHDLGDDAELLAMFPNNPDVRAVAQAILGEDLKPSTYTRGVYLVFPTSNPDDPDATKRPKGTALGPHNDQVCQQLNAAAYLRDVPPRCGGFTVYPGSHKVMFQAHEHEANWSPRASYLDAIEEVVGTIEPLELVASQGSVIFWHGRLLHSVGIHTGEAIRWALFADFTQNRESLSDDEHREVGQYEWFKDAKLFREDYPVSDDMWRHWRIGESS
jgi:hypothetical protein